VKKLEITEEAVDSITLKLSTKGVYSWEIKVYFVNEEEALNRLERIDAQLRERFGEGGE